MDNLKYDLSGSDNKYRAIEEFVIFQFGQMITLSAPGYHNSIHVYMVNDQQETEISYSAEIVEQTWTDTVDADAMSTLYRVWNKTAEPNDTLSRKLQLNIAATQNERVRIRVKYQKFWLTYEDYHNWNGEGPVYSPSLGKFILEKLDELGDSISGIRTGNQFGVTGTVEDFLEEDLTGINPDNRVTFELHEVDTANGRTTITPARGSFYPDRLEVCQYVPENITIEDTPEIRARTIGNLFFYDEVSNISGTSAIKTTKRRIVLSEDNFVSFLGQFHNGRVTGQLININGLVEGPLYRVLTAGEDYEVCDINLPKTERCSNPNGVYDNIRFLKNLTGMVLINYQAFGGHVNANDARGLRQSLSNIEEIMSSTSFMTTRSLENQPVIKELRGRLHRVEDYLNDFYQVQHEVYMGLSGFNWFNIAEIYDLDWEEELGPIDEVGTFRVESKEAKWCYEFVISVDLRRKIQNVLRCKMLGTNGVQVDDFKDYFPLASRHNVGIRLCWINDGGHNRAGLVLQLGWDFSKYQYDASETGITTDTVIVTNKSGSTSKWRLMYNPNHLTWTAQDAVKTVHHSVYEPCKATDTAVNGVRYFSKEPVYLYFKTQSKFLREGVEYYRAMLDLNAQQYYQKILLPANTLVSSLDFDVYERKLYDYKMKALTVSVGDQLSAGWYKVNPAAASDTNSFTMPDESTIWTTPTASSQSKCVSTILEPDGGLIAWAGNLPLDLLSPGPEKGASSITLPVTLSSACQDSCLEPYMVRSITVDIYDRKDNRYIAKTFDMHIDNAEDMSSVKGEGIFFLEDMCGLIVEFSRSERETSADLWLDIEALLGTSSVINKRFDLRQVRLHF